MILCKKIQMKARVSSIVLLRLSVSFTLMEILVVDSSSVKTMIGVLKAKTMVVVSNVCSYVPSYYTHTFVKAHYFIVV